MEEIMITTMLMIMFIEQIPAGKETINGNRFETLKEKIASKVPRKKSDVEAFLSRARFFLAERKRDVEHTN